MPIKLRTDEAGKLELNESEKNFFRFVRLRNERVCYICHSKINKGCYALGSRYCLKCAERVINNFIDSLNLHLNNIYLFQKNMEKNMNDLNKNNLANSL